MSRVLLALVLFVVVFHAAVFVVEALLWMQPSVHEFALQRINDASSLELGEQARVLRSVLVNQGFYNLFLALAGVAGLVFLKRGNAPVGSTLVGYMCVSALGAGIVLAASTRAYIGAFLQAVPAALALALLRSPARQRP